jgi:hypothetical protein
MRLFFQSQPIEEVAEIEKVIQPPLSLIGKVVRHDMNPADTTVTFPLSSMT